MTKQILIKQDVNFWNLLFPVRGAEMTESVAKGLIDCLSEEENSLTSRLNNMFKLEGIENIQVRLINGGATSLVYVLNLEGKEKTKQVILNINNPKTSKEKIIQEYKNLEQLFQLDYMFVVDPFHCFEGEEFSAYTTELHRKANCVYSGQGEPWGMINSEYEFIPFSPGVTNMTISTMIGLLINYYNSETQEGITQTRFSGDDFILKRQVDLSKPLTARTNLKLIAARELRKIPFKDYVEKIKEEFRYATHYTDDKVQSGDFFINTKCALPLTEKQIEDGIEIGMIFRGSRGAREE